MKPNLLVINPAGSEPEPWVEALCNEWMDHCYVYLLCPHCGFREDNERGVRFLPHDGESVPAFGHLEAVVVFEGMEMEDVRRLRETYPDVPVRVVSKGMDALPAQGLPMSPVSRTQPLAA
jgi:hypothetical protein